MSAATKTARIVAALIALITWIGLAAQFHATFALVGSLASTLAVLLWYFTIITNLLVAVVFTGIAIGRETFAHPSLLGGTTLYILLVGVIYGLLLHGLQELSGGSAIANILLHMVTPILVPIFWLIFIPKGKLSQRDPLLWAIYPLAYLFYALVRGEFTHRYPYPFMNVNELGWGRTLLNTFLIAVCFLVASWLFVWFDSLLTRRIPQPSDTRSLTR
jgi:hypothetical protein